MSNKLYYPDTGLLVSSLDEEAQEDLRVNKNLGVYKGALYENFVAEAFVKQGLGKMSQYETGERIIISSISHLILYSLTYLLKILVIIVIFFGIGIRICCSVHWDFASRTINKSHCK